jgi:hypothetical protein
MIPEDRREYERYEVPLPCMITISEDNVASNLIEHRAKNISGGGIYIKGYSASDIGAKVRLDIIIPSGLVRCSREGGAHISATGCVVRLDSGGTAVSFRDDYRVSSLEQMLRFLDRKRAWLARQCETGVARIQSNHSTGSRGNNDDSREGGMDKSEDPDPKMENDAAESVAYAVEA